MDPRVEKFMAHVKAKNPAEPEFLQAVQEVVESLIPFVEENPKYKHAKILERMVEPERVIIFRVPWINDKGEPEINRGYRIQMNSAIGPYKGGIRFHPTVNLSILKFLAFEQTLKNSLTTLPMGGGKGGSDFDPKGKSSMEIMRFCQSFMLEMWKIVGPEMDVPAGDIGVAGREIGYLFGMYKKLTGQHNGVLTGKGLNWGGSLIRPEATGYGVVYFVNEMLATIGESVEGKTIAISGFGNVAWGVATKATELGAKVITISGPDGYIFDKNGVKGEKVEYMRELRASNDDIVKPYSYEFPDAEYYPDRHPWEVKCDIAIPCATQNELNVEDAQALVNSGCMCVCEAANMPCTTQAVELLQKNKVMFAPGKAANAGGVATSGLEMSQNAMKLNWARDEIDARLHQIMKNIHASCLKYGQTDHCYIDYVKGANIAGFLKVANAMLDQGVV
jgi:glutamate dehydrogenase (NADP+)